MENTNKLSTKFLKNKYVARLTTMLTAVYYGNMSVYCDGDDFFGKAESGLGSLFTALWGVAKKLLPVAIAICVISIFFTHDERKLETEKRVLVGMVIAFAVLWILANYEGILENTIGNLFK